MVYFCVSTIDASSAPGLARRLVEKRLAACVNIVPGVRSIYFWKGEIRDEEECVLLIKTAPGCVGEFEEEFRKLHPYDCPELLMLPVDDGLSDYLAWVEEATTPAPSAEVRQEES